MANKKTKDSTTTVKSGKQQSDDYKDYSSFKIVLFYCSLIVFLPIATFFLLKTVLFNNFHFESPIKSNIYSAVGAVVALHVALGLYIYRAYFGVPDSKKVD